MFYISLDLTDLHDNSLLVKLSGNKLFKIDNIYLFYKWDTGGGDNTLTLYIEEENQIKAENQLIYFIDLMNFLYDIDLTITSHLYLHPTKALPSSDIVSVDDTNNRNFKKIHSIVKKIKELEEENYKIFKQSIKYYSRSLKLMELELYEESFLTAYKPIELISNYVYKNNFQKEFDEYIKKIVPSMLEVLFEEEYRNENKDKEINETAKKTLRGILTSRRKISKMLTHMNISSIKDEIGAIVKLRNEIAAHSNSGKHSLTLEDALDCQRICKQILTAYLLNEMSDITKLDCERKIYF